MRIVEILIATSNVGRDQFGSIFNDSTKSERWLQFIDFTLITKFCFLGKYLKFSQKITLWGSLCIILLSQNAHSDVHRVDRTSTGPCCLSGPQSHTADEKSYASIASNK